MKHNPLIGKFVHFNEGEHYRTGQIINFISDVCLVQFDNMSGIKPKMPMALVPLEAMTMLDADGNERWHLFNSRKDLNDWLAWLDSPEQGAVISIVKEKVNDLNSNSKG